ncbi:MAG: response regulator transcription factor [Pseudomonadota bacterium]
MIVDDHPLFRDALSQALETIGDETNISDVGSLDELNAALDKDTNVDLILLDLSMPGVQGFSGLLYLRAQHPEIPVAIVSATEDPTIIRRAIDFGASGFIPKSQPTGEIRDAVKRILNGDVWTPPNLETMPADDETDDLIRRLGTLTPQQVRVLMMLGEGLLNKQIAYKLGVSEATIKAHVSAILQKLGVDSRTQAVIAVNKIDVNQWNPQPLQVAAK